MDDIEPAFCTLTVGTVVGAFVTTCCCVLLSERVLLWCARLNNTMNDPTSSAVNNTATMVLKGRCHGLTLCMPLFILPDLSRRIRFPSTLHVASYSLSL